MSKIAGLVELLYSDEPGLLIVRDCQTRLASLRTVAYSDPSSNGPKTIDDGFTESFKNSAAPICK